MIQSLLGSELEMRPLRCDLMMLKCGAQNYLVVEAGSKMDDIC
jgi:hypothetical protein